MQRFVIDSLSQQMNTEACTVALGNFDGVHLGHRALLTAAQSTPFSPAVFTFSDALPQAITTQEAKYALFEESGVQLLFLAPFSLVKDLSCREFVSFLKEKLACRHVICGYNFRFGKGASGDAETLSALAEEFSLACTVLSEIKHQDLAVSSSRIRALLQDGKIDTANLLLGHPYSIAGCVQKGYSIGKHLQVPTLNLPLPPNAVQPKHGVYVSATIIDGKVYPAITNVGNNPTFERDTVTCETFLLEASGDFYGKEITVQLLSFLREEKKFRSPAELKEAIAKDLVNARRYHRLDT